MDNADDVTAKWTTSAAAAATAADDEGCNLYDFVVCTIVIGLICVFGLTGNITSFVVMYKQKNETAAVYLLQNMAVFDSLLLAVSIVIYTLPSVYPYTGRLQSLYDSFDYISR